MGTQERKENHQTGRGCRNPGARTNSGLDNSGRTGGEEGQWFSLGYFNRFMSNEIHTDMCVRPQGVSVSSLI